MKKSYLITGIVIAIVLLGSYFIHVGIEDGGNYTTETPLLGILILYNPFILGIYILIDLVFIVKGVKS